MGDGVNRLDAFTDAAFAFAVTLMVVGGNSGTPTMGELRAVAASAPSFAIGFAIIAMFWLAHVRWRKQRGAGDWRGMLLTLALVFAVLLYVHPLRAMAASFANYLSGRPDEYGLHLADMFALYGIGFVTMSMIVMLMFLDASRAPGDAALRRAARGEAIIWAILVVTGIVAALLTRIPATSVWAPFAYATLPVTIGLFVSRYRWDPMPEPQIEGAN
jgi:uncharacterized membrane protein